MDSALQGGDSLIQKYQIAVKVPAWLAWVVSVNEVPAGLILMLPGFRSRCVMPFSCAA
jgi:hypothetical protein